MQIKIILQVYHKTCNIIYNIASLLQNLQNYNLPRNCGMLANAFYIPSLCRPYGCFTNIFSCAPNRIKLVLLKMLA